MMKVYIIVEFHFFWISRNNFPVFFQIVFFYLYIDMAFKLYSLNESFRKYQMENLECQMYVACEAGKQLHGENHEDFGSLTKRIHKIFK